MEQGTVQKAAKKVGADGLTKKERRALKMNLKGDSDTKVQQIEKRTSKNNSESTVKDITSNDKLELKLQNKSSHVQNSEETNVETNKELSKSELRAQRRALQEAQRLAKTNAKNVDKEDKPKVEVNNVNSKAELRAQRSAVQEAQRLAKTSREVEQSNQKLQNIKCSKEKTLIKKASPKREIIKGLDKHKVPLFNHLYFQNTEICSLNNNIATNKHVHAAFLRLGAQYFSKTILGSNARCLALLSALKCLIDDFKTPPKQEFCRSLESTLQICVAHLQSCRQLAVSMTNALSYFKLYLTQINTNLSDNEKRAKLTDCVDRYIQEEIFKAGDAISLQVTRKICNGDVVLTYGCSSLIKKILLDANKEGKKFKVIVVDARPLLEGKEMLRMLVCAGIQCTYVLINAVSFIMSRVTKVLLGAHALLANGYVMSRTGTAQIALIANAYNTPVLVCCETYKFCERVQTDSFVYNEIGDPDQLITIDTAEENSPLVNWRESNHLIPLNLMYDVTPPDLVTAVVTELAFLPCTSVPVILRIRPTEIIT